MNSLLLNKTESLIREIEKLLGAKCIWGTVDRQEIRTLADKYAGEELSYEGYLISAVDNKTVLIAGRDETGLFYGAQEALSKAKTLGKVDSSAKSPKTKIRGICTFMHNQSLEDKWFYDKDYWKHYFDMMVESRLNTFYLVFGHQTHYMSPMFPYFLEIDGYNVNVEGVDDKRRKKNYEALQYITAAAEEFGIDFILGIWQFKPWDKEHEIKCQEHTDVSGITYDNVTGYTKACIKRLVGEFPGIKGIQVRVNFESGIPSEMQNDFFTEALFKPMSECKRNLTLDFRGWLNNPTTLNSALDTVKNTRVSCKYWGEFMGGPYQPIKATLGYPERSGAGYSYSNFLEKPHDYDIIWELWSLGSPRIFEWGDIGYMRRFISTLNMGGGIGFTFNPQLAQKGYGNYELDWQLTEVKNSIYKWDFQKYWFTYYLFGTLGYDPGIETEEILSVVSEKYRTDKAQDIYSLKEKSSKIINFIQQYSLYDPNMYIWPEIDMSGLLQMFVESYSLDENNIYNISDWANDFLSGNLSAKLTPGEAAAYLKSLHEEIISGLQKFDAKDIGSRESAACSDARILAWLGLYISKKILAACNLSVYKKNRDFARLLQCHDLCMQGTEIWKHIILLTQDIYPERMYTAPLDNQSWKRKLELVYEDELRIVELIKIHKKYKMLYKGFDFGKDTSINFFDYIRFPIHTNYNVEIGFEQATEKSGYSPEKGFGFSSVKNLKSVECSQMRMIDKHLDDKSLDAHFETKGDKMLGLRSVLYQDMVYGEDKNEFIIDLDDGSYNVDIVFYNQSIKEKIFGPFDVSINGSPAGTVTAYPFENKHIKSPVDAKNGKLEIAFSPINGSGWFVSAIIVSKQIPKIIHTPIHRALLSELKTIDCTMASELMPQYVALNIEGESIKKELAPVKVEGNACFFDISTLPLTQGEYKYSFAAQTQGDKIASPEYTLFAVSQPAGITVNHVPLKEAVNHSSITVEAKISAGYGVKKALLHYTRANQFEPLHSVDMIEDKGYFKADIPEDYADTRWDLLYYIEITDGKGFGAVYPDFKKETPYFIVKIKDKDGC